MRRTRLGNARVLSSRLVFVLIALAFVGSGYLIGKYVLASLLRKTPGTGEPVSGEPVPGSPAAETATVEISTNDVILYRVQIGAFSGRDNADKAAEAAAAKGVGAAVMNPDPLYKVYCGIAGSKATAEKIASAVQPKLAGSVIGKNDTLYVGTLTIPGQAFSLTGVKDHVEAIKAAYDKSTTAVQSLLTFWDGQITGQSSSVSLSSMKTDLASVKATLASFTPEANIKTAYDTAVAALNAVENAVVAAEESVGGDSGTAVQAVKALITSVDTFIQIVKAT